MDLDLKSRLMEYGCRTDEPICENVIQDCTLSFRQLRDQLYLLGKILYEDQENQIYVAVIRAGFWDMSGAVVAILLQDKKLSALACAKEGLIKQNICQKVFLKLQNAVHGKRQISNSKRKWLLGVILLMILAAGGTWTVNIIADKRAEVYLTIDATKEYNIAVEEFNTQVAEYNEAVLQTCIDNISDMPSSLEFLTKESESFEDNAKVIRGNNSKEKIKADTETIKDMTLQVEQATAVVKQITAPSDDWVIQRLATVDTITGTQAVTEELDPDNLLGREGGFSGCVYFTVSEISPDEVPGDGIVGKGTDAGGAVEIYATLEEAEARCEYLSGFTGTILYPGSYAIVGTMVIRTSFKLTNEQQMDLTDAITKALTSK